MTSPAPRIKLALVITELAVGGAERCLVNLAQGIDRSRFDPVVFAVAPRPSPPLDALVEQLERSQIPVHFLDRARKWQVASAVRLLRGALQKANPSVIQSMLFHANVLTRLAKRGLPGGVWCAGIRVADPSRVRQTIERHALATADRVVCVSRLVADYAAAKLHVLPDQLAVVPNGVDIGAVASRLPADLQALGVPVEKRAVTCVARLARQKGIDQLVLAAPQILRSLPEHDLLVVGDGPLSAELRWLARQTGVADRMHFCGWRPDVGEILRASDLLVLPSRWEGMPNVLLEAMASGLPVVCTRVEGVLEVLGPLAEQQVVPPEDPQVFAQQVVKVLTDESLRDELGSANRRRVADSFSLSVMLRRYETLYSTLSHSSEPG